jgi:G3E family GTPase
MIGRAKILNRFIDRLADRDKSTAVIRIDTESTGWDNEPGRPGHIAQVRTANLKESLQQICSKSSPDLVIVVTSPTQPMTNSAIQCLGKFSSCRLDSVTMVLNSLTIEDKIEQNQGLREQAAAADLLLTINSDLIDSIRIQHQIGLLRNLNPKAPILALDSEDANPAQLYGLNLLPKVLSKKVLPVRYREKKNGYFDQLSTYRIDFNQAVDRRQLLDQLEGLTPGLYRAEGIVDVNHGQRPHQFRYVGGRFDWSEYPDQSLDERLAVLVVKSQQNSYEIFID